MEHISHMCIHRSIRTLFLLCFALQLVSLAECSEDDRVTYITSPIGTCETYTGNCSDACLLVPLSDNRVGLFMG